MKPLLLGSVFCRRLWFFLSSICINFKVFWECKVGKWFCFAQLIDVRLHLKIQKLFKWLLCLQALDLIREKNVLLLMDSSLEGQYVNDDATKLVELASKCLQSEARDRGDIKFILTVVAPLQKQKEVIYRVILRSWNCYFFVYPQKEVITYSFFRPDLFWLLICFVY